MNLPRFFTMATTIMDIPTDILHAFVGDPTCQLRYTCIWFRRHIDKNPFTMGPEMVASAWYSVRIPDYTLDCVRDSRNMGKVPTWTEIIELRAPFLILRNDTTFPAGLLLWDRAVLPHLAAAARVTDLYKFVRRIDGTGRVDERIPDVPGARYVIIGVYITGYLTRVAAVPAELSSYGGALVYERLKFADFTPCAAAQN